MTETVLVRQILEPLKRARTALAEARTVDRVKKIRDQAEALRVYAQQQKYGLEVQNQVAEIKLRAERQAGRLLAEMEKQDGGDAMRARSHDVTEVPPTLADLGIERMQSSRWQAIASLPEEKFEGYIKERMTGKEELTSAGVIRLAKRMRGADGESVPLPIDKFRVIYADPPWSYGDKLTEDYGAADHHYPSMSLGELMRLEVGGISQENAVLFLWVTSPMLPDAFPLIRSWGFEYKASFVWDKIRHNYGHYNSVRHELLLLATRGSCLPEIKELFDSVVSIERSARHSEKPEEFRAIIDRLYPSGRRIELFARNKADGWESYGDELSN